MNSNNIDYSQYTIYELYDEYFKIDRVSEMSNFISLTNEIKKRFNLNNDAKITDDLIRELYSPYLHKDSLSLQNINLADRIERLIAIILDSLIIGIPFSLIIFLFIGFDNYFNWVSQNIFIASVKIFPIGQLLFFIINVKFLLENGQTIGKKIVGIKITDLNGDIPSLINTYVLRTLVSGIIMIIPFIGRIYSLLDPLFIFRKDKRCIHDLIAETIVVKA